MTVRHKDLTQNIQDQTIELQDFQDIQTSPQSAPAPYSSRHSSHLTRHSTTYQAPYNPSTGSTSSPPPTSGHHARIPETAPKSAHSSQKSNFNIYSNGGRFQHQLYTDPATASSSSSDRTMAIPNYNLDRYSFGFNKLTAYPKLIRWRFSDVVFAGLLSVLFFASWHKSFDPFQRQFFVNDLTISHPFAEHERVTGNALLFCSFVIPTAIIGAVALLLTPYKNKTYVLFVSLLGLYISLFTNCLLTEILKVWIGRHRPDFLARCIVKDGAPLNTMVFAKDVCTTTNRARLMDGFKTTPSGHSSISFSGLGYLTIWLCGQLLVCHIDTGAWRTIVSSLPLLGASYIAFSRTEDYRHHFVDVLLGSLIGTLIAWWSYRRIFPKITDEYCFLPYQLLEEEKQANGGVVPYAISRSGYQLSAQHEIHDEQESI